MMLITASIFSLLIYISPGFNSNNDKIFDRGINDKQNYYNNPIIKRSLPDPTVIKAEDGNFYLYATEDIRNIPIYKSEDLINWQFVGTVFTEKNRPSFFSRGGLWAPDINYIKGKYVLYYVMSKFGERVNNGIGVAISESPEGPFRDLGCMFTSEEVGVKNSIDAFLFEDKGSYYLFWGSNFGIYGIQLNEDGLSIKKHAKKVQVAGNNIEGVAIEKRNGFYYLFASAGYCCSGDKSSYHIVYGRSEKLFGPYITKHREKLLDKKYELLLKGNSRVAGPGHQSRLIIDEEGQDWLIYHGYLRDNPSKGRVVFMDRIEWNEGWPHIINFEPSSSSLCPVLMK